MSHDFHELRVQPLGLAVRSGYLLLLVDDIVVDHTWYPQLISSSPVSVEDHLLVLQMFVGEGFPLHLPDGPGPGVRVIRVRGFTLAIIKVFGSPLSCTRVQCSQ